MVARSIGPTSWPAGGRRPRCACTSARRVDRAFCRRGRSGRSCPPGVGPRTATNAGSTARSNLINDGYAFVKDIPSGQPEPPLLLCDDETGEPRWHRGHRRRPETAAPQCGGVLNAAGGKAIRILDARDDRKAFGAAHGRHQREQLRATEIYNRVRGQTQVPEITAAIQSFLNAGFRSAAQVEFVVVIGDEGLHPLQKWCGCRVSGILFLNMLSPTIVGKRPNSLWNATMVRRRRARRAFTPRAGRSS